MDFKHKLAKLVSFLLIGVGLYHVFYSISLLFFVYPHLSISQDKAGLLIQQGLLQKAIIYYFSMLVNGLYGYFLFFKPKEEIETYHIVAGIIISVFSVFFIARTPLTTDPVLQFLINFLK